MNRQYPIRLYAVETAKAEQEWVVEYPDLPGCIGTGKTIEEALAVGEDNKITWLEISEEENIPIPEPSSIYQQKFSGKFNIRMPKSLHRELAIMAEDENTSLNTLCTSLLSKGISGEYCLESIKAQKDLVNTISTRGSWIPVRQITNKVFELPNTDVV